MSLEAGKSVIESFAVPGELVKNGFECLFYFFIDDSVHHSFDESFSHLEVFSHLTELIFLVFPLAAFYISVGFDELNYFGGEIVYFFCEWDKNMRCDDFKMGALKDSSVSV